MRKTERLEAHDDIHAVVIVDIVILDIQYCLLAVSCMSINIYICII